VQGPAEKVTDRLRQINSIREVAYEKPYHILEFPSDQEPQAKITEAMVQSGWTLLSMESIEMSLEEIFLQLTTEEETGS
jgi:ABC-2 type transport system ATP-binding protein